MSALTSALPVVSYFSRVLIGVAMTVAIGSCSSPTKPSAESIQIYAMCGNVPNYGPGDPGTNLHRWRRFPIRVYLDISRAPPNANVATTRGQIEKGLRLWQVAGGGIGSLSVVSDALSADLVVSFDDIQANLLGTTTVTSVDAQGFPVTAKIQLTRQGFANLLIAGLYDTALSDVSAHEMGHVLFVLGHSSVNGDVMAPVPPSSAVLSSRDINTIRNAYCQSSAAPR